MEVVALFERFLRCLAFLTLTFIKKNFLSCISVSIFLVEEFSSLSCFYTVIHHRCNVIAFVFNWQICCVKCCIYIMGFMSK